VLKGNNGCLSRPKTGNSVDAVNQMLRLYAGLLR
jgi:hypothetical protein